MQKLFEQIKTIWGDMTPQRRTITGVILVAVALGMTWVIAAQSSENWKDLGTGLTPEDLRVAAESLEAKQIPVRLLENGVIQVPEERIDEARLVVSTASAASGTPGMELFNESTFGISRFQEKVNYHRALEGELGRTIRSLAGVESARVHLVIPERRLFRNEQQQPSASVKLTLKGTSSLDRQQIAGIRHLVSSAIEGLNSNAVTIVDHRGTMLARPNTDGMMTDSYFELQQQYERTLESRIIDLLEPLVGEGKVRTQVSAVMDFSRVELTQRQVDPEKQVVTGENRTQENSTSIDPQAAGVAGAAGNIPPGAAANNAQQQNTRNASSESIQYQTDSSVRQTSLPEGRLERLSVAVAVDGSMIENEAGESIWEALPPETMTKLEELVSKAAGITTSRGDELVVVNTQFQLPAIAAPVEPETPMAPWMRELIQWGALALLLLILVFGVVRPVLNAAKAQTPALVTPEGISFGTELPSESAALPSPAEVVPVGERLRLRAIESTRSNPDRAVQIIRTWLHQED